MCTKCTLACRGGEECRFVSRLPRERRCTACGMCRRKTQAARCMVACSRWKRGSMDTPPLLSIHYRLSGRRSYASPPSATLSLRSPYAYVPLWVLVTCVQCGFPPRHVCAAERRVLPYLTLYTIRYAERSAGFLRLRALRFLQSTVAREDGLSVSFRQLYVNLTEPSLSSGNNVINSTGPVVVRLAERAKTNVNVNNGVRYGRDREITD